MRSETGMMIVKNGKGWGIPFSGNEGDKTHALRWWVDLSSATIYPPGELKNPVDAIGEGSPLAAEFEGANLVSVERKIVISVRGVEVEDPMTKISELLFGYREGRDNEIISRIEALVEMEKNAKADNLLRGEKLRNALAVIEEITEEVS